MQYKAKVRKVTHGLHEGRWVWECSCWPSFYNLTIDNTYIACVNVARLHMRKHRTVATVELPE